MRRANRIVLPVGMLAALVVALGWPQPGAALGGVSVVGLGWSDISVIVIFLINGLQMRFTAVRDPRVLRAVVVVAVSNLLVAPALAAVLLTVTSLPLGLAVGVALMSSVPTTLSSATVISVNVGGDRAWALSLTITTVLLGALTAPVAVSLLLSTAVEVSPWPLLREVLLLVLLPTLIGVALRLLLRLDIPLWVGLVPSLAVVSVVWVTLSQQAQAAVALGAATLLGIVAVAVIGHTALLGLGWLAARSLPLREAMPVLFVTAQKTLPLALTILVILVDQVPPIAAVVATATLTCVAWHFLQVLLDSVIAQRVARSWGRGTPQPSTSA